MKTRAGLYFLAFFCSPLYFFIQKKPVAGVIHTVIYLLALPLTLFVVGVFMWFGLAAHALLHLSTVIREDHIQRQAQVMQDRMASTPR